MMGISDLHTISLLALACVNAGLGFLVLIYGFKQWSNILFFLLSLSIAGWIVSLAFLFSSFEQASLLFWGKLSFFFGLLFFTFMNFISFVFLAKIKKVHRFSYYLRIFLLIISIVVIFSPYFLQNVYIVNGEYLRDAGFLFYLPLTAFLFLIVSSFINFFVSNRCLSFKESYIVKTFGFSLVLAASIGFFTNIISGFFDVTYGLNKIGPYFSLIFVFFSAYAIIQHSLFNLRVLLLEVFSLLIFIFSLAQFIFYFSSDGILVRSFFLLVLIILSLLVVYFARKDFRQKESIENLLQERIFFETILNHQIRSPLTEIDSKLYFLKNKASAKNEIKNSVDEISGSMNKFKDIVNELLVLLEVENVDNEDGFKEIDLGLFLSEHVQKVLPEYRKRGLDIDFDFSEGQFRINAQEKLLEYLFDNIFTNILHYSDEGIVKISLNRERRFVKLIISNPFTLPRGISDDDFKQKIVNDFQRGHDSSSKYSNGSGLGLTIIRKIVERFEGNWGIEVEDNFFTLYLLLK